MESETCSVIFSQNLEDTIIMRNFALQIVNSCVQSRNNDKEGN